MYVTQTDMRQKNGPNSSWDDVTVGCILVSFLFLYESQSRDDVMCHVFYLFRPEVDTGREMCQKHAFTAGNSSYIHPLVQMMSLTRHSTGSNSTTNLAAWVGILSSSKFPPPFSPDALEEIRFNCITLWASLSVLKVAQTGCAKICIYRSINKTK